MAAEERLTRATLMERFRVDPGDLVTTWQQLAAKVMFKSHISIFFLQTLAQKKHI